jgi:hypothetical protein
MTESVNTGLWSGGFCTKGHDLSLPDAWMYRSGGNRECRECAVARLPRAVQERRKRGLFSDGIGSWKS